MPGAFVENRCVGYIGSTGRYNTSYNTADINSVTAGRRHNIYTATTAIITNHGCRRSLSSSGNVYEGCRFTHARVVK